MKFGGETFVVNRPIRRSWTDLYLDIVGLTYI